MYKLILIVLLTSFAYTKEINIVNKYQQNRDWIVELEASSDLPIKKMTLFNGKSDYNLTYNIVNNNSTLYFLIDSSSPMRNSFLKGIKPTITNLYKQKNSNNRWIISTFDNNLRVVYNEYNKTKSTIEQSLNQIKIEGKRTELWKNTLEAMNFLINLKSKDKKILVICSDGKAEDKAYTIENVIEKANENNITILSLGYRDLGTEKTDYIQNMERVASDTNGKFWNSDKKHQLPKEFLKEFNGFIKKISSKHITIKLPQESITSTVSGKQNFILTIDDNASLKNLNFVLDVPKVDTPVKSNFLNRYLYYILGVIFLLFLLFWIIKKDKKTSVASEPLDGDIFSDEFALSKEKDDEYIGYFESLGGTKHYIYKLPSSIGSSNADIVIEGSFISRRHAIIDFKNGYFFIIDTDSSNKLFVDGKEVLKERLVDGSRVSFGPYETIFKIKTD